MSRRMSRPGTVGGVMNTTVSLGPVTLSPYIITPNEQEYNLSELKVYKDTLNAIKIMNVQ